MCVVQDILFPNMHTFADDAIFIKFFESSLATGCKHLNKKGLKPMTLDTFQIL